MKLFKIAIALCAIGMLACATSCSHKVTTTPQALNSEEVELKKTKSQEMAESKPGTRAYGEATHMNQSFARTYAEGQARAEFARKLSTMVQTASRQATDGALKFSSDAIDSSVGEDQGILSNAFAQQVADGPVKSTVVINTDTFKKRDGQYHVYVCIEWQGDAAKLADAMTANYKKKVEQQVSDEERVKMEVRYEDFKKSLEEQLNRLQGI